MAPPSQKAAERPISFVLHDTAAGTAPVLIPLVIRPEDLTRSDASRLTVTQTLGAGPDSAWVDSFGQGIPTVQIAGHTGWGSGNLPNGLEEFENLHAKVFRGWHEGRAEAVKSGQDPDKVRLIFSDGLDDFTWLVAPQTFVLKRSKSRPLLAQYQISLTWLASDAQDKELVESLYAAKRAEEGGLLKETGLESLMSSIEKIQDAVRGGISKYIKPVQRELDNFLRTTGSILTMTKSIVSGATSITGDVASSLIGLASTVSRIGANVMGTLGTAASLPLIVKAQFMRVASAYENAFCLLNNIFKPKRWLPDYSGLYGSSNCSATSGGSPLSVFDFQNPFPVYLPNEKKRVLVTVGAAEAMEELSGADTVLRPPSVESINANLQKINDGVTINA